MKTGDQRRFGDLLEKGGWWSAVAALVLLSMTVLQQQAVIQDASVRLSADEEHRYREALRGRLLGEPLPVESLNAVGPSLGHQTSTPALRVVWVIVPDRCHWCQAQVQQMNRSVLAEYPDVVVVMSGVEPESADQKARDWGLRVPTVADPEESLRARLRLPHSSTFLLVSEQDRILHVDFQRDGEPCRTDILDVGQRLASPRDPGSGSPQSTINIGEDES